MKTIKLIFTLSLTANLIFSCTREAIVPVEENEFPVVAGEQVLVPFTTEAGAMETKVEMNDGKTADIVFSAGDKLMVFQYDTVDPSILTLKSGAGTKSAVFTGDLVLKTGKTEADLAGRRLSAILIPEEGAAQGVFKYDSAAKKLTVDYSTKAIDSDIEALVKRCIIYEGETYYESRKFNFEMLNSFVKMNVQVPYENHDSARVYTVTVTNDPQINARVSHTGRWYWNSQDNAQYSITQSGSFQASFRKGVNGEGTLYLAVMTREELRYYSVDSEYDDRLTFSINMKNDYKGYELFGGTFTEVLIHGRGYTKTVTLRDNLYEDVLKGQPALVRSTIGGDKNSNGYLSKYEAAQITSLYLNPAESVLEDASFLQYFTGLNTIPGSFLNCKKLTKVILPKNIKDIERYSFQGCEQLSSINIPSGVTSLGNYAFRNCYSLKRIIIPSAVKTIGESTFENCFSLEECVFETPCNVTTIYSRAFVGCSNLEVFSIPPGVTRIYNDTFYKCTKLTGVSIPSGVSEIDRYAFFMCSSLKSISIPASVKTIYTSSFKDCSALERVTCKRETPPSCADSNRFFDGCGQLKHIYVPAASVDTYKNHYAWKRYASIISAISN